MKKTIFGAMVSMVCAMVLVTGCGSTKVSDIKDSIATEHQIEIDAKKSVIVDWADRGMDNPAKPEWLKKLVRGNADVFRKDFGIEKSYVIKYGIASGKTRDLAKAASRVNYNAMRAEELRTKVVSEAASTLNDDGLTEATGNAAMVAKADLSGHELVTQFWQEVETFDPETEAKTKEFICYSVYKISRENWLETLKAYMKQVLPKIPNSDAQKKMAATIASLYEDTTKEVEKTEEETLSEINAKIDAIGTSSKSPASPAPNPSDIAWLDVLETACNVIF